MLKELLGEGILFIILLWYNVANCVSLGCTIMKLIK